MGLKFYINIDVFVGSHPFQFEFEEVSFAPHRLFYDPVKHL